MSEVVWQGLTKSGLDQQFNLRARWPTHEAALSRWARDSERVRSGIERRAELRYGAAPLQNIDLFPAVGKGGPAPLLVFIHGGYWQSLDKSDFSFFAPTFLSAGISLAQVNYRLAPEVSLSEIVEDVTAALDHLQEESHRHGYAADDFVVAGHSAGGHLAVMELLRERQAVAKGSREPRIGACCSISGVYDLAPMRRSYQQPLLAISEAEVSDLSPLRRQPASAPPLMLAVGDQETAEFVRQQNALVAQWQALDLPIESLRAAQRDHFTIVDALLDADHPLTRWLIEACQAHSSRRTP